MLLASTTTCFLYQIHEKTLLESWKSQAYLDFNMQANLSYTRSKMIPKFSHNSKTGLINGNESTGCEIFYTWANVACRLQNSMRILITKLGITYWLSSTTLISSELRQSQQNQSKYLAQIWPSSKHLKQGFKFRVLIAGKVGAKFDIFAKLHKRLWNRIS